MHHRNWHGAIASMLLCAGGVLRSKSVGEFNFLHTWARTCTPHIRGSSGLVAQYLHGKLAYVNSSFRLSTYIQLDCAGTVSLPKEGFLQGNPNLLPNNLARQ